MQYETNHSSDDPMVTVTTLREDSRPGNITMRLSDALAAVAQGHNGVHSPIAFSWQGHLIDQRGARAHIRG